MCGIAGFINFDDGLSLAHVVNRLQAHRGPDHHGVWQQDNVTLAHQRLSIIDLSARSNQPFVKEGLVMIFNGEIYNYATLRADLESKHQTRFITSGDTEVVLEMYRVMGLACFEHFIGMFSFALYDIEKKSLLLARDHFGIKPMYLYQQGNRFAFASELKSLTGLPGFRKEINFNSLVSAANYLWVPGNESIFQSVTKLPPGHFAFLNCGSKELEIEIRQYFSLKEEHAELSEEETIQQLRWHLEKTVERHMVADVPVSSFLSGGLDSSLISVLAKQRTNALSTFTIATQEKDKKIEKMPDDERYARSLAKQFGFDHTEVPIDAGVVDMLPSIVRILDEPLGDPAAINTFLICKRARERGVKVLLSGMGADEIFFGYRRQQATLLAARYQSLPSGVRKLTRTTVNALPVRVGSHGVKITRWGKRFLDFADLPLEQSYRRSYSYYDDDGLGKLFNRGIQKEIGALNAQHASYFNERKDGDLINNICNTDIHLFMQGLNLTYTDRASMAASVEVRVPFIDREMIRFAMSIPGKYKYKKGEGKYILKKAAETILPNEIIYRPKASFGAPIRSWISNELRPMIDDLLSESSIRRRGLFNYSFIKNMIDQDRKGTSDFAYQIYFLLTLEVWFKEFVDQ